MTLNRLFHLSCQQWPTTIKTQLALLSVCSHTFVTQVTVQSTLPTSSDMLHGQDQSDYCTAKQPNAVA